MTKIILILIVRLYAKINKDELGIVTVVLNTLGYKDYIQQSMQDEDCEVYIKNDKEVVSMQYTDNPYLVDTYVKEMKYEE